MGSLSRRQLLRWTGLGSVTALAGCNTLSNVEDGLSPSSNVTSTQPELVSNPDFVVNKDDHMFACSYRIDADSQREIAFLYREWLAEGKAAEEAHGSIFWWKCPTAVRQGQAVTLVVPEEERENVSLLYGPAWSTITDEATVTIDDGYRSVRFEPCSLDSTPSPELWTHWGGGFVVRGKRCVTFNVWVEGESEPRQTTLSFGAGMCNQPDARN